MPYSPSRKSASAGWTALLAAAALAAPGCLPYRPAPDVKAAAAPMPLPRVETSRVCLELMDAQKAGVGREEFVRKVGELLANNQQGSASRLIRRFPDVAWEVARGASNTEAANPAVRFVAKIHDEQCNVKASVGWSSLLQSRIDRPEAFKGCDKDCAVFKEAAGNPRMTERFTAAGTVRAPHVMMEIETARLAAEAMLQQNRPAVAVQLLTRAFQQAKTSDTLVAAHIALALGDAHRRAGELEAGAASWQNALELAQEMQDKVADPGLWTRLAALRPANVNWPIHGKPSTPEIDNAIAEAEIWKMIGQWRLERGEFQTALFAFKRAEANAQSVSQRDELQLLQAKTLLNLHQDVAAVTMLARLSEVPDTKVVAPALGLLGSIKLRQGDKTHGLALLQRAVQWQGNTDWPGRAEAQADLGLAYLMNGDEMNGLHHLHAAQAGLEKEGAGEMLIQCLGNEARYLDGMGHKDQAGGVKQRIESLQNAAHP